VKLTIYSDLVPKVVLVLDGGKWTSSLWEWAALEGALVHIE